MMKVSKPVLIVGGIAALATAAYTGLPPPHGWFFKAVDFAYGTVKSAAPEGVRQFIDNHPVYTAGLEGLVAGAAAGLVTGATAMWLYYRNKNASKK
ncbi:hypothetical protein HYU40_02315 [Candidatus Woesearchaeota archaeon]|nr:hypothetical protein [Candidatus Woesearchaeota archaeon]